MTDCDADAAAAATAAAAAADFIRRPAAPGRTIDGWPKTCCISNRRKSRLASERSGETLGRDGEYSNSWERGRERERERERESRIVWDRRLVSRLRSTDSFLSALPLLRTGWTLFPLLTYSTERRPPSIIQRPQNCVHCHSPTLERRRALFLIYFFVGLVVSFLLP